MNRELRVGSNEVCQVTSVDEEKGYINLSKKRVATEDCAPKLEMFAKAKNVHGIMQYVASSNEIDIGELCAKVSWPLTKKYTSAFDVFKKHVNGEIDAWKEVDFSQPGQDLSGMQEKLKTDIETVLTRRLMSAQVRLQAKCEVSCFDYDGIDAVKAALLEGLKASQEEIKVNIKLIAHPLFALSCLCQDKELGVQVLEQSMELVQKAITSRGGAFEIKAKPTYVATDKELEVKSESSGESSDEGDQDETMGTIDESEFARLKAKAAADDA
eukprot:SRR837773.1542.p1 GENE.SRR837773.1542~~SRR837773.1542.p1  ORF type:complete len:314 (-),score=174.45 SRR837773.1542:144-953(-)